MSGGVMCCMVSTSRGGGGGGGEATPRGGLFMWSGGCVRLKGVASGGWVVAGEDVEVGVWAAAWGGSNAEGGDRQWGWEGALG